MVKEFVVYSEELWEIIKARYGSTFHANELAIKMLLHRRISNRVQEILANHIKFNIYLDEIIKKIEFQEIENIEKDMISNLKSEVDIDKFIKVKMKYYSRYQQFTYSD